MRFQIQSFLLIIKHIRDNRSVHGHDPRAKRIYVAGYIVSARHRAISISS
jgi:hypothetical protein